MTEQSLDVVVVGGGPAGLSAALILGRMRRRVLLLDTDAPANAVSKAMHGFLSRDGTPPAEVRRVAVEQLEPYETVERRTVAARSAGRVSGGFEIALDDGSHVTARRLLLAHGMRYGLPQPRRGVRALGRAHLSLPVLLTVGRCGTVPSPSTAAARSPCTRRCC